MNDTVDGNFAGSYSAGGYVPPAMRPDSNYEPAKVPEKALWAHPTGRQPETIAIVACGPTFAEWHGSRFTYELQTPRVDEVWTLNKGLRTQRADLGFVMDDILGEKLRAPEYFGDLVELAEQGTPIITSRIDEPTRQALGPDALQSVSEYPLLAILETFGDWLSDARVRRGRPKIPMEDRTRAAVANFYYLHNSIPYLLAYAAWLPSVREVHLYGCDYTFPGMDAREDDRANAEFWVGVLRMLGVAVIVTDKTTLLNQRRQPWAYGYGARQPLTVRGG